VQRPQTGDQRRRGCVIDVDEHDAAAGAREARDDGRADAGSAARNEDGKTGEIGIVRAGARGHLGGAGNVT